MRDPRLLNTTPAGLRRALWLLTLVAAMAHGQPAPVPELKMTVAVGTAFPLGKAAQRWSELLTERAQRAFTVKLYPGATLAQRDAAQEFRVLKSGGADLAAGSALAWSDPFPPLGVVALPWLAPTARQLDAVVGDPRVTSQLADSLAAQGIVLVALVPLGHRELAANVPVRALADLAGLRVRAPTTPLIQQTYVAAGARPAVASFADAQAALQAGTLDAQDGMPTALVAARVWGNGLRHATQWGAFADAIVFAVRATVWQAWPEPVRAAAREAAGQAAREAMAADREEAALAELAHNGVAVTRVTPAGHAAFRAAVRDVYTRWTPAIGAPLVEAAQAAARAAAP
jgi:TRAP-type C4-dicarboxylate transport system substrate-binding protein